MTVSGKCRNVPGIVTSLHISSHGLSDLRKIEVLSIREVLKNCVAANITCGAANILHGAAVILHQYFEQCT